MCLAYLINNDCYKGNRIYYKIMEDEFYPLYSDGRPKPIMHWIGNNFDHKYVKKFLETGQTGHRYRCGFHSLTSYNAAMKWITGFRLMNIPNLCICKVLIRDILAVGVQAGFPVVVSKYIKIIDYKYVT